MATFRKSPAGVEDIAFDSDGGGGVETTQRADGTYRTVRRVNASHIPVTATTRAKDTADGTDTEATTVDGALQELYTDVANLGVPDDSTLENDGGTLQVKDDGITGAKIGDDEIDSEHYAADSIDNEHLAANAVAGSASGASGDNVIEAASIDTADIADEAIEEDLLANDSVGADNIIDDAVGADAIADDVVAGNHVAQTTTSDTTPGVPVVYIMERTAAAGTTELSIDEKVRVFDVTFVNTDGNWDGTHGTAQVTDADDNAITDAVVMGAGDNDVKRAGEIYDANYVEAGTLKLVTAAGAGSVGDVEVYIQCVRVS